MKLTEEINATGGKILVPYFLFLAVLEVLAYRLGGIFSVIAARIWLATALFCLLLFLITALQTLLSDLRNRQFLLFFGYLLILLLFIFKIGNLGYSDVSFESTQQLAAGLESFSAKDFNYTGVAFLDYANRQYVLNALPALLLGRSVVTLHLGFALPFLMGVTLWFLELRAWLRNFNLREEFALLPLYALPVFPYITEYFMNFEQTLNPVSYTLLGLALLLRFYRKRDAAGLISLSFVGGMCCNSYTPVLAFFGFLLVFLGLWGLRMLWKLRKTASNKTQPATLANKNILWQVGLCFTLIFQLCCYFAATLVTRQKDMITTVHPEPSVLNAIFSSWFDFFLDREALFWGIWLFVLLAYMLFALLGILGFSHFLVAGWMLLTAFFSSYLAGYTTYDKAHEIQRNMLILPVFVTAVFFATVRFFKKHPVRPPKFLLPASLALLLALGQYNFCREHHSFTYYRHVQPMKYMLAYTEELLAEQDIRDTEEFNLILLTDNRLLNNLSDYTTFFYPAAHAYVFAAHELPDTLPTDIDTGLPTLILCETDDFPKAMTGTVSNQSFENKRYNSIVTWYCLTGIPETP